TVSRDNSFSLGFDIAPAGHYGGNLNTVSAPTRSGNWDDNNNILNQALVYGSGATNNSFENIYFRNPGEATITNDNMINRIGRDNLVRFKIDGSAVSPRLEPQLEQFSKKGGYPMGTLPVSNASPSQNRDKRTQIITMLSADDATKVGLEKSIRNYQSALDV